MATVCDYCSAPIDDDAGRVTLVPTPDPTTMKAGKSLDFHVECQRAFLKKASGKVTGTRPTTQTAETTPIP